VDINALFQALQPFEDTANGTFVMPVGEVDGAWVDVRALLTGALAAQTLTITGISSFPAGPSGGTVTYRGQGTLFPWSGAAGGQSALAVTAWFTVDGAGQPQLRVQGVPPSGWDLGQSLSGLAGTPLAAATWNDGAFLLTSTLTTSAAYPGPVTPWVNFSGVVAVAGPFSRTGILLASPESRALTGHVDLSQGAMPVTTLAPAFPRPADVGGVQLDAGARLSSFYKTFPDLPGEEPVPPYPVAEAAVAASVRIGALGTAVPLAMRLTPQGDTLPMTLDGPPVPLTGLNELASLAGGTSLDVLPPDVPTPNGFVLKGLSMAVDLGDGSQQPARASVSFDVSLLTGGWVLVPAGILTLDEIGVALRVDFDLNAGLDADAVVYGRVTIVDEMHLLATVSVPRLDATLGLDDGTTVSLASLMEQFMTRLTGRAYRPPVDMVLERLEIALSVRSGEFQVGAAITTAWSVALGEYNGGALVTFGLDGISFFIEYDGSVLSGTISALTHIGSTRFYLTAGTEGGPDAGWELGFGMVAGDTISVTTLLLSFMYPEGQTPGEAYGIPSLVVGALDLFLSTDPDNTPFAMGISGQVEGSWTFKVFSEQATTFTMAASFELAGRRALVDHRVPPDAEWAITGSVSGRFTLFGLLIEAGYEFAEDNSALRFGIWYGNRGLEAAVTRKTVRQGGTSAVRTMLTVRLGDLSLGEILEFFVSLALPGETRRLPSPWDVLYQIDFRNLTLAVDLDTYDVSVDYALNLDLGFASLGSIGILYTSAGGESQVLLRLTGDFLGQPYGTDDASEPLQWDVLREPAPAVPGKGPGLVDIRYVGLGQHVALPVPDSQLKTVTDVIEALKAAMGPVAGAGNPLDSPTAAGMRYDGNSRWLFGVDATLLETFSLAAVFYDPHLYGALIEVAGPRGGSLSGLRFELMYRRITDAIGEFSVDLRVPDAFRNWEFGEVSVTLGILHVDIYTNGNFRVNAGFPANGDFSVSFSVQVFPFIGQGGFYFAYLTGATSERVPAITNGTFDPVIEAGVGLAVGVGKEFQKGPLSAGLALEVYGIFEGIYAPFHPYEATVPRGTYYWFQGTAGIVGKLYGSVDFVVVKASVSVVARAQAVLTIEAHRASHVELSLEVTAKAKVKVLFVTIHFSFSLTLDASFTLGSDSPTPWIVGPAPAPHADVRRALVTGLLAPSPRPLRQQRSQAPRPTLAAAARETAPARSRRDAAADLLAPWAPVAVYGDGSFRTARFQFLPAFTVADPSTTLAGGTGGANQVQIVLLLAAENTIDPAATTAEEVRVRSTAHLHQTDDDGNPAFAALVETFFRWAAMEGAGVQGTETFYGAEIAALVVLLRDPAFVAATFAYANLAALLDESLHFEVLGFPSSQTPPAPTSGTFLAMIPEIVATFTQGSVAERRDYTQESPASERYARNLAAYFAQLATDVLAGEARNPAHPPLDLPLPTGGGGDGADGDGDEPSMAELVFGEYFALLTQAALQAGADLLAALPVPYPQDGPSLATLAAGFPSLPVTVAVARGQTPPGVAAMVGMEPSVVEEAVARSLAARADAGGGADTAADALELPHAVTPLSIAQDNAGAALAPVAFNARGLAYQVRAAQTLDGVASAVPQQTTAAADPILGPLTGAAIGTASAGLPGLLRTGAPLAIPSFAYTPLAGDTDTFLPLFFQVRNDGPAGVRHGDWYAQAIATLNPDPVDWTAWGTETLVIPSAYLDTTGTATYVVHQGDTLDRVAATLALYQQGPAGTPLTGSWTVPATTHTVTPTDTFARLAVDFPGLAVASLVATNTAADVLTPLTPILLPAFGVRVTAGQTLAELAAAFDLAMDALVALVQDTPGLFAPTTLTLRDVPGLSVDALVAAVAGAGPANEVAAQVSRFLLHGLRVPSPQDAAFTGLTPEEVFAGDFTGLLYGSFDAAKLQYAWADLTVPVTIELSSSADWVTLMDAEVHDGGGLSAERAARNPSAAAGRVIATDVVTSISVTVSDAPPFDAWIPAATLTLDTTAAVMPAAETGPSRYELPSSIHWQAAAQPALDGGSGDAPGEPSIWLFSDALRAAVLTAAQAGGASFSLLQRPLSAPPDQGGTALSAWAWAVQVPFTVHRVPALPPPGVDPSTVPPDAAWLPTTYVVDGADQAGEDLLYALWTHLASTPADAASRLYLLYPPNATGDAPAGLASDQVGAGGAYLLKTNLSTETRQASLARAAPVEPEEAATDGDGPPAVHYSAALDDATAFATFLWEATSVQAGGFYLHYEVDGAGLPSHVFDPSGRAALTLLCLLASQSGTGAGRTVLALNNCAVVEDNVDASAAQVYAVQSSGTIPQTTTATMPPGNVGFTLSRPDPVRPGTEPTPAQDTQLLYNLFGYQVAPGGGFGASNEALPAGPGDPPDHGTSWYYQQVLQASRLALPSGRTQQGCAALPSPQRDPYAGVSAAAAVTVGFAAHDAFGNRAVAADPLVPLPLPFRYTDPLIGVGEWPGASVAYLVDAGGDAAPRLVITMALQSGNYLPAPGVETAVALQTASAHALRYERIFYQGARPGVQVSATTTLAPASATTPLPLVRARFQAFASTAYVFTSQLAALPPVWHTTGTGETLATVSAAYSVTPEDLLVTNADHDVGTMFADPVVVPLFARVKQGETIDAFASRTGTQPAALLSSYANGATPVPVGVAVAIAPLTHPADGARTLDEMALAAGCTPAQIAAANADAPGLLAAGIQLIVRDVLMETDDASTFTSLAAAYAAAGVTTTAAEVGAANAALPGIFREPADGVPVTYTVNRSVVLAATTVDGLVAAKFTGMDDFVARNGAMPGVLAQNTPLQTGVATRTAPSPVSVRGYAERTLAVTVAQFAAANAISGGQGSPPIPTLAPGVRLMLPALLDAAPLSAVAYAFATGESLDAAAARFGTTAQALGTSIQDIGGVFVPAQPVTVDGAGPVYTTAEDSIETLRTSFPAGQQPTLDALIAAIAPSTTLLRAGSAVVCPPATVAPAGTTLAALGTAYGVDGLAALGRCNAALDGFLDPAKSLAWGGDTVAVGPHGTLISLYRRVVGTPPAADFDAFLTAIAPQDLLRAGAGAILPPPGATAAAALPASVAVTDAVTELGTTLTLSRPIAEVAPEFGSASPVAARTTPVTAYTAGVPASYTAFAQGLQDAYAGRLRVGSGKTTAAGASRTRLYVVRFEAPGAAPGANAIREISVLDDPSFYALPPLCRELLSRAAQVRIYRSGAEPPLPGPPDVLVFRAVDAQAWAAEFLAAVDLVLSTAYAAGAFAVTRGGDGTSASFDALVAAKKMLAEKVAAQLDPVLPETAHADPGSAREALRQRLDVSLVSGWSTAAVVQLPSQVDASFGTTGQDAGGHRFAGKPLPGSLSLDGASTLGGVATAFSVDVQAIGRVLGGTPNLLEPGIELQAQQGGPVWTVGPHGTLEEGAEVLGMTVDALSVTFSSTAPLFRDGATVTLNGYAATVAAGDSLESMSDQLASGVAFLAVANQTLAGLLAGTVYVGGVGHPVTPETATLQAMAASLAISVDALAVSIAGQAVLTAGKAMHVAALLPDYSLSASKVDLDVARGAVNLVLQMANPASYRRILLDLGFPLTGFEYGVTPAPLTEAYETSDWLQFVTPLAGPGSDQPATIDVEIGQVDVPIPLRAYPAPPVLVGQYADPVPGETLDDARLWTYRATFETQTAAQDLVWLTVGFNFAQRPAAARRAATDDPFAALAEYVTNAAAIQADLRNVLLSPAELEADPTKRAAARSATAALAEITGKVAAAWGFIPPDPPRAPEQDPLAAELEVTVTLETRTRPASDGTPLIDLLLLTRQSGSSAWGPDGVEPWLGFVDAAGALRLLEPQAVAGHPDQLAYVPPVDVPAFERRVFAILYPRLDAVATQNARTTVWITRNELLVPGKATNEAFVYRTPATHFAEVCAPALVHSEPISLGAGPVDGLTAALTAMFTELLGDPPTAARTLLTVTVRYGYTLVPGLDVLSPVVMRPTFAYATAVPAEITAAVQVWMATNPPAPGTAGFVTLELMVFPDILRNRQHPVLDLLRLDYGVTG
jgi:LysM repeat protein